MHEATQTVLSDPRPEEYHDGILARMLGATIDETQPKPWRDGWADADDELRGAAAYEAGNPDDPNQTKAWRLAWHDAQEASTGVQAPYPPELLCGNR